MTTGSVSTPKSNKTTIRARIIIIEKNEADRKSIADSIKAAGHGTLVLDSLEEALLKSPKLKPDIIFVGEDLPQKEVFDFCEKMKGDQELSHVPIVALQSSESEIIDQLMSAGIDDIVFRPVTARILEVRINAHMHLKRAREQLMQQNDEMTSILRARTMQHSVAMEELTQANEETIFRLAVAAEYRDDDTGSHLHRISHYCALLAKWMNMSEEDIELIKVVSPMHDIGKIAIPDAILQKPGKLTDAEFDEMKRHTNYGAEILKNSKSKYLKMAEVIAMSHHEKWNGRGYPLGQKEEEIPLAGRIMAVADVFDALMSKRCYKEAFSYEKTIDIMTGDSGTHFDPTLIDIFFADKEPLLAIREQYP